MSDYQGRNVFIFSRAPRSPETQGNLQFFQQKKKKQNYSRNHTPDYGLKTSLGEENQ